MTAIDSDAQSWTAVAAEAPGGHWVTAGLGSQQSRSATTAVQQSGDFPKSHLWETP